MTSLSIASAHPEPTSHPREALPARQHALAVHSWERDSLPCAEPGTALQAGAAPAEKLQRAAGKAAPLCTTTDPLARGQQDTCPHPGASSCLQTPARKGWLSAQGCAGKKGLCAAAAEEGIPAAWHSCPSSTKTGPCDRSGQQRAASNRKAAALLLCEQCWHSQVTAEVTFELMACLKLNQKGNTDLRDPGPQPSQGRPNVLLCMQTAEEAPRAWGAGKGLPSHCQEAAHSALPCPSDRLPQPQLFFAEGLAQPSSQHKIQPRLWQQAATSWLYGRACRDVPTWHCPPCQLCPHPQSQQCWDMAMAAVAKGMPWDAARFGRWVLGFIPQRVHLPKTISNSLHRFYTGNRAEVSVCSVAALPRERCCPWQGALVISVQARTLGIHMGGQSHSSGHRRDPTSFGTPCLRHAAVRWL